MPVYKNENNGTWYAMVRYKDWKGERRQKCQRGFPTKREAQDWERQFQLQKKADIDMTLASFCELYEADVRPRLKENTWLTKESIIQKKILPYLGKRKLSEITAKDIVDWQNEMRSQKGKTGKPVSSTYLKTIHAQLSSIFNHAIRYYDLNMNPARAVGFRMQLPCLFLFVNTESIVLHTGQSAGSEPDPSPGISGSIFL